MSYCIIIRIETAPARQRSQQKNLLREVEIYRLGREDTREPPCEMATKVLSRLSKLIWPATNTGTSTKTAAQLGSMLPWEFRTLEALQVPQDTDANLIDISHGADLFRFSGLCALADAGLSSDLLSHCHDAANRSVEDVRRRVSATGLSPDDPNEPFRFQEACQRGPGRVDIRLDNNATHSPFDHPSLGVEALWLPLVHRVLGENAVEISRGIVCTEPGTTAQRIHADGPPLFPEMTAGVPCHAVTVFVPLVDQTVLNGATSFYPGTHHTDLTSSALRTEGEQPGTSSGAGVRVQLELLAGSAVLFDYRLFHNGEANKSAVRRPLLCFVYARSWWHDTINFPSVPLPL